MKDNYTYHHGGLKISILALHSSITVIWEGTADARDPEQSFAPFLRQAMRRPTDAPKRAAIDFRKLAFLNSAAVSPIFQMVKELESSGVTTTLHYDEGVPWQRVNATCMRVIVSRMKNVTVSTEVTRAVAEP